MDNTPPEYTPQPVINLGWRARPDDTVLHLWHTRPNMRLAVSACNLVTLRSVLKPRKHAQSCPVCYDIGSIRPPGESEASPDDTP